MAYLRILSLMILVVSCSEEKEFLIQSNETIAGIGFDLKNSFVRKVNQKIPRKLNLKRIELPLDFSLSHDRMPIIVKLTNRSLFVFASDTGFISVYDINTLEEIAKLNIKDIRDLSNGFYDKELGVIYWNNTNRIVRLDISTLELEIFSFDLKSLVYGNGLNKEIDFKNFYTANTAIRTLKAKNGKKYLYWGYSVQGYDHPPGMTGILAATELIKGIPQVSSIKAFYPSKTGANQYYGRNTGIWNVGTSSPQLRDGSLMVSTANGVVDHNQKNFGCSVLKIKIPEMRVEEAYSSFENSNMKCFMRNYDYGVSTISLVALGSDEYGIVSGRGLPTVAFDTKNISKKDSANENTFGHSSQTFGAMPIYVQDNKVHSFSLVGKTSEKINHLLLTESFVEKNHLSQYFKKGRCVGILPKKRSQGFSVLYSGGDDKDFVPISKDNPLANYLTVNHSDTKFWDYGGEGFWIQMDYFNGKGFSLLVKDEIVAKGFRKVPVELYFEKVGDTNFVTDRVNVYTPSLLKERGKDNYSQLQNSEPLGYILSRDEGEVCADDKNFEKVYEYKTLPKIDFKSWGILKYSFGKDLKLKSKSVFKGKKNESLYFSSPSLYLFNETPLLIYNMKNTDINKHYIIGQNMDTNKEVFRTELKEGVHFTMPILYEDKLIISTIKGIEMFKVSYSK